VADTLLINEIYLSLQGESSFAGWPCVFIRLTGCNLRCSYCDTAYAFAGGQRTSQADILAQVEQLAGAFGPARDPARRLPLVELTGGEPLLQTGVLSLMQRLCDLGFTVLLETSGAQPIHPVDPRVHRIVDVKCPSSGEVARNLVTNLEALLPTDELKFVIATDEDYAFACETLETHQLADRCPVLFSWAAPLLEHQRDKTLKPVPTSHRPLSRLELADRVIADRLPVRFQLQLHKFIWPVDARGV